MNKNFMKKALVTGITGQDGSYLAELLLEKGYEVHGIVRRASTFNTDVLIIYTKTHLVDDTNLYLHYGDLADAVQLVKLFYDLQPDEIYNLGAQSHVRVSFDIPEYTGDVTGVGAVRILEAIREAGLVEKVRYYQASSSEMYGKVQEVPQVETHLFGLARHMHVLRFMLTGLLLIIVSHIICMQVVEYSSIMNLREEVKLLLPVKLPEQLLV